MNLYNYLLSEIGKLETLEYNDLFQVGGRGYGAGILERKEIETIQVIRLMIQDLPGGEYWEGVKKGMADRLQKMERNYERYWAERQEAAHRANQMRNQRVWDAIARNHW